MNPDETAVCADVGKVSEFLRHSRAVPPFQNLIAAHSDAGLPPLGCAYVGPSGMSFALDC